MLGGGGGGVMRVNKQKDLGRAASKREARSTNLEDPSRISREKTEKQRGQSMRALAISSQRWFDHLYGLLSHMLDDIVARDERRKNTGIGRRIAPTRQIQDRRTWENQSGGGV